MGRESGDGRAFELREERAQNGTRERKGASIYKGASGRERWRALASAGERDVRTQQWPRISTTTSGSVQRSSLEVVSCRPPALRTNAPPPAPPPSPPVVRVLSPPVVRCCPPSRRTGSMPEEAALSV